MPNLWLIFTTGLITGGITCVAVQGGLLATLLATQPGNKLRHIAGFLGGKLVAYTFFGFLLGLVGNALSPSVKVFGFLQLAAGIYMLGIAGAMLNLHPAFRYFLITTPRWAGRLVRSQTKSESSFADIVLGLATILIPCGTTQAMLLNAVTTGSPIYGALIMLMFTVGTMPLFILLGLGISAVGVAARQKFNLFASIIVIIIALVGINGGLVLVGSPFTAQTLAYKTQCAISFCDESGQPVTQLSVSIGRNGYTVDHKYIQAGKDITLNLKNINGSGCQQAFSIPSLNISKIVGEGQADTITFKAPEKPGLLAYSCSMGMYEGQLVVVN